MDRSSLQPLMSASRGLAMPAALMILFVMVVLVGGLMGLVGQELREVAYTGFDNRALYLADSGVQEMVMTVEEQNPAIATPPPTYLFPPDPNGLAPSFTVNTIATKYIDNRRVYLIQSQGTSSEGYNRWVEAELLEDSFASMNYIGWSNSPNNYFVSGLSQYNGPVYLGGNSTNPVNVWWNDGSASLFLDKVTMEGSVAWWNTQGQNTPQTQADWLSVDAHGKGSVYTTQTPLKFPPDAANAIIANEALSGVGGPNPPSPTGNNVFVNGQPAQSGTAGALVTGIYVNGSTDITMAASSTTSNPQTETITFKPGSGSNPIGAQVTVTINYTANTTTVDYGGSPPSHSTTYTGVPDGPGSSPSGASANGAIYVNGDVTSLSGSVKGQHTIAVPDSNQGTSENNITVSNDITYQNDPQTCGCASTDILGIIAHDVLVKSSAPANLTIEAAVFAGNSHDYNIGAQDGTFETDQRQRPQNLPLKGPLLVYGSMVNNYISPLGVFDPSNGNLTNGWADSYTWDTRFAKESPPFYPSLNTYSVIGWKDCGSNSCS